MLVGVVCLICFLVVVVIEKLVLSLCMFLWCVVLVMMMVFSFLILGEVFVGLVVFCVWVVLYSVVVVRVISWGCYRVFGKWLVGWVLVCIVVKEVCIGDVFVGCLNV